MTTTEPLCGVKPYLEAESRICREIQQVNNKGRCVSISEFVLKYGRQWPKIMADLPNGVPVGVPRACYMNAAHLALEQPDRFTYVEGYAAGVIPLNHAWVVDEGGTVVDPTWAPRYHPDRRSEYFGIPIKHAMLKWWMLRSRVYGLIDCPPEFEFLNAPDEQVKLAIEWKFFKETT